MTAVLYAIPASHPCATVERALQLKRFDYRRVDLVPGVHALQQRARFGAGSVPGVVFADGERAIGSRPILRALEERVAEPSLLPAEEERRARVERAEEWGDQVLQPLVRRVVWAALRRAPGAIQSYTLDAHLPVPAPVARATAPLVAWMSQRRNGAADPAVRADLIGLRTTHLDRIDGWVADGVIGGDTANVADLQIGASLALLMTIRDVAPLLSGRPATELARRWFPAYPGVVPAGTLPAAWVNGGQ